MRKTKKKKKKNKQTKQKPRMSTEQRQKKTRFLILNSRLKTQESMNEANNNQEKNKQKCCVNVNVFGV